MKKFLLKTGHSKNPGESLIEVLVAVVILSTVLTATFAILNRTISTNVNVKNRIIAINIAREGLEAVRNIRDTNWLKYSGDRRGKWLCADEKGDPDKCFGSSGDLLVDGFYTVDFLEKRYFLTDKEEYGVNFLEQSELNLTNGTDFEDYRLYQEVNLNRYTHISSGNNPTIFYRQIELVPLNPFQDDPDDDTYNFCGDGDPADNCDEAKLKIIARVQWREGNAVRNLILETHLFDFLERTTY